MSGYEPRKFSAVLGTDLPYKHIVMREFSFVPLIGAPSTSISKNTFEVHLGPRFLIFRLLLASTVLTAIAAKAKSANVAVWIDLRQ